MKFNKKLAKKILGDVSEECRFFCANGNVFSNLKELRKDMENMNDETFSHHAEQGRNDFSNWIRDCLGDDVLAKELLGLNKKSALKKIGARISYLEKAR